MHRVNAGLRAKPFNSTTNVNKEIVTSAGWGRIFSWQNESKTDAISTCMTTHEGPTDYQFQFCDMKYVKV